MSWTREKLRKMAKAFFFDTCTLIEIGKDNPAYASYKKDVKMILTKLNLLELAGYLFKHKRENEIQEMFNQLNQYCVEYDDTILIEAAKMKNDYKKERLSYIDCIGYLLAKKHKAKFLTSDGKFEKKKNVEFVR